MRIVAAGIADERGVHGTSGLALDWEAAGIDPLGDPFPWERIAPGTSKGYRRLDRVSRLACLAAEAAAPDAHLGPTQREETALVLGSTYGCLDKDLRFERSLHTTEVASGLFPFTLPSACLGILAIRFGLRGPTHCLSTAPDELNQAIDEARSLIEGGEAAAALVCLGDCLPDSEAATLGVDPRLTFTAFLMTPGQLSTSGDAEMSGRVARTGAAESSGQKAASGAAEGGVIALQALLDAADPIAALAAKLRQRQPRTIEPW